MNARWAAFLGGTLVGTLAAAGVTLWMTRVGEPMPLPAAPAPQPQPVANVATASAAPAPDALPVAVELPEELAAVAARYRDPQDPNDREWAVSELAASGEPAALAFLIGELRRTQGAERRLLLDGVIEFGSREAIPALRELAGASDDADEKAGLVQAAEYLALPSLTEVRRGEVSLANDAAP